MRRLGVACMLWLLAATPFAAEAQMQSRSSTAIEVTLVEVPVNVYDRAGNPIRGLTAHDFEILDEGRKREITNFEEVDLAKAAQARRMPPPAARRNFMLLFDLSNSTPVSITRSIGAAVTFVKTELLPSDVAAVATYSVESGFRLLTNFTSDRRALEAAITTMGDPRFFKPVDPLMLTARDYGEMKIEPGMVVRTPKVDDALKLKTEEYLEVMAAANASSEVRDDDYRRGRIQQQVNTFANIARILDSVSGRKQVILLSEGFDAALVQGREGRGTTKETQEENDKVVRGAGYEVNNDERFGSANLSSAVTTMGELLRRSDVVLHAIDIKGLRTDVDASAGLKKVSLEGLYVLTRPTGGQVFKNANDLSSTFQALLKQQEVVYILGFQTSSTALSKFHPLKVKVKVPGATVSHRSGYYESGSTGTKLEATLATGEILLNDVPLDDVKTHVITAAFPVQAGNPQVPVIIEIEGQSLLAAAKGDEVKGDLFIYAFDQENRVADFLFQRVELDLKKVGDTLRKSGLKYYGALSLAPGQYTIKTLVRLFDAKQDGFQRVDITVPDFSQPTATQPIAAGQAGEWLMVRGGKQGRYFSYPFTVDSETFVPSWTWQTPQKLALYVYNIDPADLAITGSVKAADGIAQPAELSILKATSPDAAHESRLLLELNPLGLPQGRYAFDLSVRTRSGSWSRAFVIPLVVR